MIHFLRSHEGDESPVLSCQAGVAEVLVREFCEAIVEQIKLNILLVQVKVDGFEVEVALDHVPWNRAVDALATCDKYLGSNQQDFIRTHTPWSERKLRCGLQNTVRTIVSGG